VLMDFCNYHNRHWIYEKDINELSTPDPQLACSDAYTLYDTL
jgi:hypothetical protein